MEYSSYNHQFFDNSFDALFPYFKSHSVVNTSHELLANTAPLKASSAQANGDVPGRNALKIIYYAGRGDEQGGSGRA